MQIKLELSRNEAHEFNLLLVAAANKVKLNRASARAVSTWHTAYIEAMQRGD